MKEKFAQSVQKHKDLSSISTQRLKEKGHLMKERQKLEMDNWKPTFQTENIDSFWRLRNLHMQPNKQQTSKTSFIKKHLFRTDKNQEILFTKAARFCFAYIIYS